MRSLVVAHSRSDSAPNPPPPPSPNKINHFPVRFVKSSRARLQAGPRHPAVQPGPIKSATSRFVWSNHPRLNLRLEVILRRRRSPSHPPQSPQLPHMRQRIRHRTLKQLLRRTQNLRLNPLVKCRQSRQKPFALRLPVLGRRLTPLRNAITMPQRPIEKVPHMSHRLRRRTPPRPHVAETFRRILHCLPKPESQRRHGVPQKCMPQKRVHQTRLN